MAASRLSFSDRRQSILSAATAVFALHGFEGARTQQIARAAGVSEALVYRHFASKQVLYRAVLRQLIRNQNETFAAFGDVEPSAASLLAMIRRTIAHAMAGSEAGNAEGMRVVVASLAGDASYARLVYRRALRLSLPGLTRALDAAWNEGRLRGQPLAAANAAALLEHVATMMMMAHMPEQMAIPYAGSSGELERDAVRFCARGIGLDPDWVEVRLKTSASA